MITVDIIWGILFAVAWLNPGALVDRLDPLFLFMVRISRLDQNGNVIPFFPFRFRRWRIERTFFRETYEEFVANRHARRERGILGFRLSASAMMAYWILVTFQAFTLANG